MQEQSTAKLRKKSLLQTSLGGQESRNLWILRYSTLLSFIKHRVGSKMKGERSAEENWMKIENFFFPFDGGRAQFSTFLWRPWGHLPLLDQLLIKQIFKTSNFIGQTTKIFQSYNKFIYYLWSFNIIHTISSEMIRIVSMVDSQMTLRMMMTRNSVSAGNILSGPLGSSIITSNY